MRRAPLVVMIAFLAQAAIAQFAQQGPKLVGTNFVGYSRQGGAVALSADGNTALIGGVGDNNNTGAAWVFVRTAGAWQQQGPKLVAAGGVARQGRAVALSADGNTALIAGATDLGSAGPVWVWRRTGTIWSHQTTLVGAGEGFGTSLDLSDDGTVAVIGAPFANDRVGAVTVWRRNGATWAQEATLVGNGHNDNPYPPQQGQSVGISGDGNTIIVGGPNNNTFEGAAWIWQRTGATWTQHGPLVGSGANPPGPLGAQQGHAVALSADGSTAIVGGWTDEDGGATWVWVRTGSTWTQQGPKLSAPNAGSQGSSVALARDGNTAVVGDLNDNLGRGAVRIWKRHASTWSQYGPKLVGNDATTGQVNQGFAVAISADAKTLISGGPFDRIDHTGSGIGATWVFVEQVHTTTTLTSSRNPATAGEPITITATVTSTTGIPTGTVTFSDGQPLGTVPLTAGVATIALTLAGGTHTITAAFNGNSSFAPSTAAPLHQIVNHPVQADLTWTPTTPRIGEEVRFRDTSQGNPSAWRWTFGDGATSTERHPRHTYTTNGDFAVTLTVFSPTDRSTITKPITVTCPDCIRVTGTVKIRDSESRIRGNASDERTVSAFRADGARIRHERLGSDGQYDMALPPGTYTIIANVRYPDYVGRDRVMRTASVGMAGISTSGTRDVTFEQPIIFLHGLHALGFGDGPARWTSWRQALPSSVLAYTPRHTAESVEEAAAEITDQLERDFELFTTPPTFGVIAHSKGGLVARVLRNNSSYADQIGAAVLLGTPNTGSNCYTPLLSHPVGLSWCDIDTFNAKYPAFPGKVFVIAGTAGGFCPGEAGPSDGVVPADSVFKITHNGETTTTFPGVLVPQQHSDLGRTEAWLLTRLILPYLQGNHDLPPCPSAYTSPDRACSALLVRPSVALCIGGRGLDAHFACSITERRPYPGFELTWSPSLGPGLPPTDVDATLGVWTPCDPPPQTANARASTELEGYYILRSNEPINDSSTATRIGHVPAGEHSFTDTAPLAGTNYYAITAIYNGIQTAPALAEPTSSEPRRRAVRH